MPPVSVYFKKLFQPSPLLISIVSSLSGLFSLSLSYWIPCQLFYVCDECPDNFIYLLVISLCALVFLSEYGLHLLRYPSSQKIYFIYSYWALTNEALSSFVFQNTSHCSNTISTYTISHRQFSAGTSSKTSML